MSSTSHCYVQFSLDIQWILHCFKDIITVHLDILPTISRLNLDDIEIIGVLPTYSIAMRTGGGGQAVGNGFIANDNAISCYR